MSESPLCNIIPQSVKYDVWVMSRCDPHCDTLNNMHQYAINLTLYKTSVYSHTGKVGLVNLSVFLLLSLSLSLRLSLFITHWKVKHKIMHLTWKAYLKTSHMTDSGLDYFQTTGTVAMNNDVAKYNFPCFFAGESDIVFGLPFKTGMFMFFFSEMLVTTHINGLLTFIWLTRFKRAPVVWW